MKQTLAPNERIRRGWVVVLAASLFFFYEFIQMNLFNAIDQDLMRAFNLNAPQLGQLSSMFFYANAIFIFPAGILLDRFSTKKLLVTAVLICAMGTLLFSQATTYWLAAVSRFVDGIGAAFCFLSCIRIASRWFPPNKMAFVTGMVVTMAMLGGLVAQTPFAILSKAVGWRHAVLVDASVGIIIALIIAWVVEDRPPGTQEEHLAAKEQLKKLGLFRSLRLVLANRHNWFGGIYTALVNLPVFLLGALFGIHYLVQVYGLTVVQGSYATTMFFLGVIFGSPAFGWFSDHIGRRVLPMVIGAVASLLIFLMLMYIPHLSLTLLIFLFFWLGFLTSSQVLSFPTIAELNPIALTSTAVSIDSFIIMLSGVIFQPLFGWLMERDWDHKIVNNVSIYSVHDFNNAMIIMPMAFVIAIFIALSIKETYCQSQVE
jgi:MFS family permease